MESRPPSHSHSLLTRWMGVGEANLAGNVHGGWIMKLCDEVAGIAAIRHSGHRVVTAAIDRMNFHSPIFVGELVTLSASVNAAWRTSMEVGVRVEKENVWTGERVHTSTAYLTMVALDTEGQPVTIPALASETPEDLRRAREAQLRRDNRLTEREQLSATRSDPAVHPARRADATP